MAPFATVAELGAFLGVDLDSADPKAIMAIAAASAACQIYTRQRLERVEDDVAVLTGNWSGILDLPERPAISVSAVTVSVAGGSYPVPDFILRPQNKLLFGPAFETLYGPDPDWDDLGIGGRMWGGPSAAVQVTYTHGFDPDENPDQWAAIKAATLMIASRLYDQPGTGAPVTGETIGVYAYTLGQQAVAQGLVGPERTLLEPFNPLRSASVRT